MTLNNKVLDKWTPAHLGSGIALGGLTKNRVVAQNLIVLFEVVENTFLTPFLEDLEGIINIISDVIIGFIGVEIGLKVF